MYNAINRPDSLGFDVILGADFLAAPAAVSPLEMYRLLMPIVDTSDEATFANMPEDDYVDLDDGLDDDSDEGYEYSRDQFGGWSIKKAFKKATKAIGKIPGTKSLLAPINVVRDVARGKNVIKSVSQQARDTVKDTRAALPIAASVVSVIPGVGTGVSVGLTTLSSISQGKSLRKIAEDAAVAAIPGGALIRMGVSAAVDVARGKNVGASLLNQGLQFAKTQLPGGPLVGQAFDVGVGAIRGAATGQSFKTIAREAAINAVPGGDLGKAGVRAAFDIAQGRNVGQTLLREGMSAVASQLPAGALVQQAGGAVIDIAKGKNVGQVLASNVGPLARNLVESGAVNIGDAGAALQFTGINPAQAVSAVKAVTRAAGSRIPTVRNAAAQVLANTRAQAIAGNPGSRIAFNAISKNIRANIASRAAPTMNRLPMARQASMVRRLPAMRRVA